MPRAILTGFAARRTLRRPALPIALSAIGGRKPLPGNDLQGAGKTLAIMREAAGQTYS